MKSDLAYLDAATDGAVRTRSGKPSLSDADRKAARSQAMKSVAGFEVFDDEAERKALDALVAKNREAVETFIADRKAVRDKLGAANVSALAVLPLTSWRKLLRNAGLFMFSPNSIGHVRIAHTAFDKMEEHRGRFARPPEEPADEAVALARRDWTAWLKRCFPNNTDADNRGPQATLVLPSPPADVIDTLLKLNRAGIVMKTAAVAGAIAFKESVPQLRRMETARREEEARRIEAMRHDPIIYTEHGSVAAVVAQFGDFPIEKDIIDAAVAADDFIPEKPKAAEMMTWAGNGVDLNMYDQMVRMKAAQQSRSTLFAHGGLLGSLMG